MTTLFNIAVGQLQANITYREEQERKNNHRRELNLESAHKNRPPANPRKRTKKEMLNDIPSDTED